MAVQGKFCGRKFTHIPHTWHEAVIGVPEGKWPLFHCVGLTADEAINMAQHPVENLEESTEDALRRYARIVAKIEEVINDEDNHLIVEEHKHDADGTPFVPVAKLKAIIYPED